MDFKKACDTEGKCYITFSLDLMYQWIKLCSLKCVRLVVRSVQVGSRLLLPVQNGLKKGSILVPLLFWFALECTVRNLKVFIDPQNIFAYSLTCCLNCLLCFFARNQEEADKRKETQRSWTQQSFITETEEEKTSSESCCGWVG